MKISRMLFDVRLHRYEMFMNERCGGVVRVRFGLQPNASTSRGSGAKVDQQRFVLRFRFSERRIGIFVPIDSHLYASFDLCPTEFADLLK